MLSGSFGVAHGGNQQLTRVPAVSHQIPVPVPLLRNCADERANRIFPLFADPNTGRLRRTPEAATSTMDDALPVAPSVADQHYNLIASQHASTADMKGHIAD